MRGWAHLTTEPMVGTCRALHYWSDLLSQQWYGAGTNNHLYVVNAGTLYDITPPSFVPGAVSSGTKPFSLLVWSIDNFGQIGIMTPSGQGIYAWTPPVLPLPPGPPVLITGPAQLVGGFIAPTATPFTGITNGGFQITVNGTTLAPTGINFSGVSSIGTLIAVLQAALGNAVLVTGLISPGTGEWQLTISTALESYSANISYASPPATGTDVSNLLGLSSTTATTLTARGGGAPLYNQGSLVTMPQQIVMAFGSSADGAAMLDPLLIRWSDQSNYFSWEPTTTNFAGSFRLPRGDRIVSAFQSGLATYIWTEYEFWTAQYEGFPYVFGFFQQGASCGLIAEKAVISLGTTTYWQGQNGFFLTTGTGFQQLPCPVWDYVYLNLDMANADKCVAATDYLYREIFFFFPSKSGGTGEIDSYVKYNVMENVWDTGMLVRTAWTDLNPGSPVGVDGNGILQQHDVGLDADGQPMTGVSATSAYIDMADGAPMVIAMQFQPDTLFEGNSPSYELNVLVRSFDGDPPVVMGPYTISPTTEYITLGQLEPFPIMGVRGREMALQITCDALDSWFRIGTPRIVTAMDGAL